MMLPASILVFHGHPLLLQQALCLSYSETTLPRAILLPHSTLTFPSAMSDASFRSPDDIWTLFRSLPHYLIVSAILCLSLCPRSPPDTQSPLVPITMPPETVLVPHGTLPALQPSLCLSYSDRTLPQPCSVPRSSLTLFAAIWDVSIESLIP